MKITKLPNNQYKLIKEYPGSAKLGNVFSQEKHPTVYKNHILPYPEFWELVKEEKKEYEILSFICNEDHNHLNKGIIIKQSKKDKTKFVGLTNTGGSVMGYIERVLTYRHWDIYSIKRLSDGEVFTIGDKYKSANTVNVLLAFEFIQDNILRIRGSNSYLSLDMLHKLKKPLFTTEDGIDIFEGDRYYWVCSQNHGNIESYKVMTVCATKSQVKQDLIFPGRFHNFSTKEKAEEYIVLNKPCLSINELLENRIKSNHDDGDIDSFELYLDDIQELVKSKL